MESDIFILNGKVYEYGYTRNNLHIDDSHEIGKRQFRSALCAIEERHPELYVWRRSEGSLRREWATHNLCYQMGYKRERTKDVDLNYPQKWYVTLAYAVVGTLALLIIK